MKSIDEYISQVNNKENISDGGSPAYCFDDVILIKYSINSKECLARENEELVAVEANKKNKKGVNTPLHLGIKRVQEGDINICWVLQEKAKGECFNKYYDNEPELQLKRQQELAEAPNYHYEKCISDLCDLFNMGIELKPKNIFYDNSKNGGFSFIDLLHYNSNPINLNSLTDILALNKAVGFIHGFTQIFDYDDSATQEQKNKSLELSFKIRKRIFEAMEKVIPNFDKFRRYILRSYPEKVLNYFKENGVFSEDLSLTKQEYISFNDNIEFIVNSCIESILNGSKELWQIYENDIRIMLDSMGMRETWNIHDSNPIKNPSDYDDEWEFEYTRKKSLDDLVINNFNQRLIQISENNSNEFLLKAVNELKQIQEETKNRTK